MQNITTHKKRIWILNHHAETPETGTSTRHYDFGKELIKRGYEVTIFASSHIHYTDINLLNPREKFKVVDECGINWVWINTMVYTSNGIRRIFGMIQYYFKVLKISQELKSPDIVIGSSVHLLACLAAYKLSKRFNIKCINEIRDLWPETLIQMGKLKRNSALAKIMNHLEDFIYRNSDDIIITAPGMKDYIRSRKIDVNKVTYINNGIDTVLFDQRCNTEYKEDIKCKLDADKFNVVYTGGLGLANDLETVINTAKILKDRGYSSIKFTFFGDGPLRTDLMKKAQALGLDNLEFKGVVPKYCIPKVLKDADSLLVLGKNLSLYKYGVSMNKLFEYLYAGVPIIFSMNTINDYIEETGDGYSIEPEKPSEMAEAIIKLYNTNKEDRNIMGRKGIEFVKSNFDIPVLVDKLEEIIYL